VRATPAGFWSKNVSPHPEDKGFAIELTIGARLKIDGSVGFKEASKERTRKRVPLDWADTQNNLKNTQASAKVLLQIEAILRNLELNEGRGERHKRGNRD
jgi:hypothetical protein